MRSEWITSTIDDICKLVTDGAHNSPKSVDNGYYMASVKDFTAYGFDFSNCRKISEADYLKLKKQGCVPESGDILVGKDGARYFEDVIIYRQKEQPALLSSIAILRVDDTKVTSEFLYYTLKSPAVKKDVRDNYGSGSAIPRIVLKDFKRMPISFPSLKEQKKITNICELLDEKIQLNNRINNNLEELVQGKKAVESPTAFLLGGQPGSGKTSLRSAILEETQGNVIVIDKEGLKAAGEWHQLKPLFPSLEGKSVLDLGCGYGWHCKFAEEQGATKILGIDLSKKMIEEAQKRNSGNQIEYRISGLEEYDYPENEWDCVISNLALHYIEDIVEIFQKVYRTLKPGGIFLFNIEHPVFTAGVGQDWIYTDDGKPQYWAIDNYFITGERNTHFLGCDVVKQHHTLTQIIMGLLNNGFELKVVEEAEPPKEMMDIPGMEDELRRPMMLLVKAIAKK